MTEEDASSRVADSPPPPTPAARLGDGVGSEKGDRHVSAATLRNLARCVMDERETRSPLLPQARA